MTQSQITVKLQMNNKHDNKIQLATIYTAFFYFAGRFIIPACVFICLLLLMSSRAILAIFKLINGMSIVEKNG